MVGGHSESQVLFDAYLNIFALNSFFKGFYASDHLENQWQILEVFICGIPFLDTTWVALTNAATVATAVVCSPIYK